MHRLPQWDSVVRMISDKQLIKVRRAEARDGADLAAVFRESWRDAYQGIIPAQHLESMILRRDRAWWLNAMKADGELLVVEAAGVIAGYSTSGAARTRGRFGGEIYELYLAPIYQGVGIGEHLFEACRHQLDIRRLPGLIVWALADNERAAQFYWQRGGRPVAETKETFGLKRLVKIGYGWS